MWLGILVLYQMHFIPSYFTTLFLRYCPFSNNSASYILAEANHQILLITFSVTIGPSMGDIRFRYSYTDYISKTKDIYFFIGTFFPRFKYGEYFMSCDVVLKPESQPQALIFDRTIVSRGGVCGFTQGCTVMKTVTIISFSTTPWFLQAQSVANLW